MYKIIVKAFGGVDQLQVVEHADPVPASQQVVVRLTSIGMNYADIMARRGEYKLISGSPPFTPGVEAGGYIEAVGAAVTDRHVGQRVILSIDAPAANGRGAGTYQSHFCVDASKTIPAPDGIADHLLGALWLPFMTAWGCLIWKQQLQPGQIVLIPAASSSVGLAASQIVKQYGGVSIGTTTSPDKVEKLQAMPAANFDHLMITRDRDWARNIKQLTSGKGYHVAFDPIAAGDFLNTEIRLLGQGGTIWIYGLLGNPDRVDVSPLIRKGGAIRGWLLNDIINYPEAAQQGYQHILDGFVAGNYQLPIAGTFSLQDVGNAQAVMETGKHIGKFILIP
jgi:NADPH:quinone reductase